MSELFSVTGGTDDAFEFTSARMPLGVSTISCSGGDIAE
jgi:hypothetical protein